MIDLFHLIPQRKTKKKNPVLDLIDNPENYILTAQIEGEEISVRIKKKDAGDNN